jgi:hypothetical protein
MTNVIKGSADERIRLSMMRHCDKCFEAEDACKCPEWGGYVESIVRDASLYDGLEIQGVRMDVDCCEINNDNPEFFSVYVHMIEGGVECIGDFATWKDACDYALSVRGLFGWPIDDFTKLGLGVL